MKPQAFLFKHSTRARVVFDPAEGTSERIRIAWSLTRSAADEASSGRAHGKPLRSVQADGVPCTRRAGDRVPNQTGTGTADSITTMPSTKRRESVHTVTRSTFSLLTACARAHKH